MKRALRTPLIAFALATVMVSEALGQTATPLTSGLISPIKITLTPRGNLVVAEAGNGPNTGRISVIDRATGTARVILGGLPSALNTVGGNPEPSGPSGVAVEGNILYITIGSGDADLPGPVPGSEVPNPSPSSPILSSVLSITTARPIDEFEGGFNLALADHVLLKSGQTLTRGSTSNELTVRLITDFPDFRFEPLPNFSGNVRQSNPFGLVVRNDTIYVVDASHNSIRTVNRTTGASGTLVSFPRLTNPTPVGPPSIDAVPDSIHFSNGQLIVTTLTGFPFPAGAARVLAVDPSTGAITTRAQNLTSTLDSAVLRNSAGGESLLVLQFSTSMLTGAPGNLVLVTGTTSQVIAAPLITPTSMAVDQACVCSIA